MASDESVTIPPSFSMQDSEYEFDGEGECDYRPGHPHSLSGMSMCTSNSAVYGHDDDGDSIGRGNYFHPDDGYCDTISMQMSQLSMESFCYGDANGHEDSSDDERESKGQGVSSDSDLESLGDSHLSPATPPGPQWRNQSADMDQLLQLQQEKHKEYYTNKNKAKTTMMMNTTKGDRCKLERATSFGDPNKKKIAVDEKAMTTDGSSEGGSGDLVGRSVVIKTRPRGGRRSLCMDLEEVKACWDLGFDHCTTLHSSSSSSATAVIMPTTTTTSLSISENSTLDTSSGTNSPITTWRISSPGQLQSISHQNYFKRAWIQIHPPIDFCFLHSFPKCVTSTPCLHSIAYRLSVTYSDELY